MTEIAQITLNPALPAQVSKAAAAAGIEIVASEPATSFAGDPTTRFTLALAGTAPATASPTLQLELSNTFDTGRREFAEQLGQFLAESAGRLRNPHPNAFLTLTGIPLT